MRKAIASVVVLLSVISSVHAVDDVPSLTVAGKTWTIEKLKSELSSEVASISYTGHDGKHTSSAVPLAAVLKASGVSVDLKPNPKAAAADKHAETHAVILVTGRDGFLAVFSMAELMPELGNRKVWVALDVDGKDWPAAADKPVKLIVPDDAKPARWVHGVKTISLMKVEPPTTQPAQ